MSDKPVAVRLGSDLKNRLGAVAEDRDRSSHYLIREAVERFVTDAEIEIRERKITLERIRNYELTGEAVPAEEVWDWLEKLKSDVADA